MFPSKMRFIKNSNLQLRNWMTECVCTQNSQIYTLFSVDIYFFNAKKILKLAYASSGGSGITKKDNP